MDNNQSDKVSFKNGMEYLESLPEWNGATHFGLENIANLLKYLGNPQDKPRSVHIAGTNGKGSVSTAVANILQLAGFRVGLLTSPHLSKINERIKINGVDISDEAFSASLLKVKEASEKTHIALTKHEVITAASFIACQNLDWIVVEVGLGGSLDASNVLSAPAAAAIVTIDFDHENILGNTLEQIAKEKAGIIKNGENVFLGRMEKSAAETILRTADAKNATVFRLDKDFKYERNDRGEVTYSDSKIRELKVKPALSGSHQADNMSLAIAVCLSLSIAPEICKEGVGTCNIPGRLEKIKCGNSSVLLDAAHNPAGIMTLISFLKSENLLPAEILFGVFRDKNWQKMLDLLIPNIVKWNIIVPPSERGLAAEEIMRYLKGNGVTGVKIWNSCGDAVKALVETDHPAVIAGSISLIGEARALLLKNTI